MENRAINSSNDWKKALKSISRWYGGVFAAALAAVVLLAAGNALLGNLNQDEGWYLYAAGMVHRGFAPYRDFAFTQGPVLPWVYGFFYGLVEAQGVLGARGLTALIGLLACGLASALAGRLAESGWNRFAAAAAFMLIGINAYHAYFSTIVKTYSLCNFFLLTGLFALCAADGVRRLRDAVLSAAGGFLLALAAGTRLSAGAALAAAGIYLLVCDRTRWTRWVFFGVGGLAGLAMVFGGAWLEVPKALRFGLLEYHALRSAGGVTQALIYKIGFLSRMVQGYYLPVMLCLVCLGGWVARRKSGARTASGRGGVGLLWLAGLAITAAHVAAPFPYDDYQVMVMPVLTVAAVCSLTRLLSVSPFRSDAARLTILLVLGAACVFSAGSSPVLQDWVIAGRDRIWWRMKDQPDVLKLREAGRFLKERMAAGELLLTQDTYLAVEANATVPRGMEMGPFCYYPDFSEEQAQEAGGVLNRDALLRILTESGAPYAAFSGYGLSIQSPDVTELPPDERKALLDALETNYEPIRTVPAFGQGHTTLEIYRNKNGSVQESAGGPL